MEQPNQQPSESKAYRDLSLILLIVNTLLATFFSLRIYHSQPMFLRIFEDFQTTLPVITLTVLSQGYAWILPTLAAIGVVKEFLIPNRRVTLIWNGVQMAVTFGVWQIFDFGTTMPLMRLLNKLAG